MANWRAILAVAVLVPSIAQAQTPGLVKSAEAFNRCVADEARRLEPSGEAADLIARAAVYSCHALKATLDVEIANSVSSRKDMDDLTAQSAADARDGALLVVISTRANKRSK